METAPPPDYDTKKPKVLPPPKSADCHFHVIGPQSKFPFSPRRTYDPPDVPVEAAWRLHETLGIERGVVVQVSVHGRDNTAMLDALARSDGRYRGVAMLDDSASNADLESMHAAGVRGVRFNFVRFLGGPPDLSVFGRVVDRVHEFGWHVDIHASGEDLTDHKSLFQSLKAPLLMEYWSHFEVADGIESGSFQLLLQMVKENGWWFKIGNGDRYSVAGVPYQDTVPFARAAIETAPDRTIWGTDWPHPKYRAYPLDTHTHYI
ncbi:MAG: amidohydrolase family protein [Rhodospirillales bacterium]|jgi:predicted TIM-barrel fold metal-dependent hydrolase|nr:amidohydrolase family protein [Rhodospirillales bacterium]|tara:strand:- start:5 stop:790 length:786 start_codon:yes stop_codon:yes gene_type:complete